MVLRRRRSVEAVDLGFAMLRRWVAPILRAWVVGVLPPIILIGVLLVDHAWLAVLVLMWLAPVLERAPLFVLSRALFGEQVGWGALLRAVPGLWGRRLHIDLILLRLSMQRSMLAPVAMLEQLRGGPLWRRRAALGRGQLGAALGLLAFCWAAELGAWAGLFSLVWSFLPDSPLYDLSLMLDEDVPTPPWFATLLLGTWAAASSLTRLLYAAGGFGLYLNRRTEAEGWDVELRFRRLAQRVGATAGGALCLAALLGALSGAQARAQEPVVNPEPDVFFDAQVSEELVQEFELPERVVLDPPEAPIEEADLPVGLPAELAPSLTEVLARPEMGAEEERTHWRLRKTWDFGWDWPEPDARSPEWMVLFVELIGQVMQLLVALLVVLLIGFGLYFLLRLRRAPGAARRLRAEAVALEGETTVAPEAGPALDTHGREALRLLDAGQPEAALALLYRGSVGLLVEGGLTIEDSATEGEVLRAARRGLPEGPLGYFRGLTLRWQTVAYAHQAIDIESLRRDAHGIGELRSWAQAAALRGRVA